MAQFAETLMSANADMVLVHRRVVRVGAAAAWFAAAVFLAVGYVAGNDDLVMQAAAPILAGAFFTVQIFLQRENGYVGLIAASVVIAAFYTLIGSEDTIIPAAVALVIICALAMVFINTRVGLVVVLVSAGLFFLPHIWGRSLPESWGLGVAMSLSFATTTVIFLSIRSAMEQLNARFQMLFEHSPAAVMEEDWSEAVAYLRSEYTGRPDRIKPFLLAYPAVVRRAVSKAKVVRVNHAAVELLEATDPADLIGLRDPKLVNEESLESFADALVSFYEGRAIFGQEAPAKTFKGRDIWLQIRAVDTSSDGSASRIIVGLADISHIKERNEAMSRLVKAKDDFIARVSHELRTPLTAVVGLTSEMSSEAMSPQEQAELLQLVSDQAAEMSYIVEDLLVAARAEMGTVAIDTSVVDLGHELEATIDGLGIDVDERPGGVGDVYADPSRVRQILRNILTNAERYGGPRRRILAGENPGVVWLEIRDDGSGVDPDIAEAIFEPYVTGNSGVTDSVGLGLSVARQLAEMMGGSLAYRRDGDETVFRLELPGPARPSPVLAAKTGSV